MNAVFQTSRLPIAFNGFPLKRPFLIGSFPSLYKEELGRRNVLTTLLLASLLLFLLCPVQQAEAASRGEIHWASLNLTQQQESNINRLESQWQETHGEVTNQMERDREELQGLLPTGDSQRIRAVQNRMMTNKMYLMNESMNTFLQKRDVLTPEQRAQLQRMLPGAMQHLNGTNRYTHSHH